MNLSHVDVGDVELNLTCEPEYALLDKYICNKEEIRIEAPKNRRSERRTAPRIPPFKEPTAAS
jgi:hypothetical protein